MSELTDLEIRKMITEIEIKRLFPRANSVEFDHAQNCYWIQVVGFESYPLLNPLTDDALCFRLMVNYQISIERWLPSALNNPNHAVCLAIIEASQ